MSIEKILVFFLCKNYLSKINNFSFFMKYLIIFLKIGVLSFIELIISLL